MKQLTKILNLSTALLAWLLFSSSSSGQWMLIDDFQQWTSGNVFTEATDMGWHSVTMLTDTEYWIMEDPIDSANLCLLPSITNWDSAGYNAISKELPDGGIAPGETGTLKFRALWTGNQNSWYIGTADQPAQYDLVTGDQVAPGELDDFNALLRLNPETDILEFWNGEAFTPTDPTQEIQLNKWYTVYLVVRNYWNTAASPPVSTGSYSIYLEPLYSSNGWGNFVDGPSCVLHRGGLFRHPPADADGTPRNIQWVLFSSLLDQPSASSSASPFLLDDFYFSKGKNVPILNEDIDTGDWLGWININHEPFILSYSVGWLYMENLYTPADGAWAFFYK